MRKLALALGRLRGSPDDDAGSAGMKEAARDHLRVSLGSASAAIVAWLRGGGRPVASTLADHARPLHQTGATHEHEHEHEHDPRPADYGDTPSPIREPGEEELAAIVDRSARAIWDVWVAGTREPTWDELPERVRERVRASTRAGLAAAEMMPAGGLEP
jgi:hypothetical protein